MKCIILLIEVFDEVLAAPVFGSTSGDNSVNSDTSNVCDFRCSDMIELLRPDMMGDIRRDLSPFTLRVLTLLVVVVGVGVTLALRAAALSTPALITVSTLALRELALLMTELLNLDMALILDNVSRFFLKSSELRSGEASATHTHIIHISRGVIVLLDTHPYNVHSLTSFAYG